MLHVGTWNRNKNQGLALELFNSVADTPQNVNSKIVLAGTLADNFKGYWQTLVSTHEWQRDRVVILGETDKIPEYMALADVFLATSFVEGNPLAVREAISMHLPVIASKIPSFLEACGKYAHYANTQNLSDWNLYLQDIFVADYREKWSAKLRDFAKVKRSPDYPHSWHPNNYIKKMDFIIRNVCDNGKSESKKSKSVEISKPVEAIDSAGQGKDTVHCQSVGETTADFQTVWNTPGEIIQHAKNTGPFPADVTARVLDPIDKTYWEKSAYLRSNDKATFRYRHQRPGFVPWQIQNEVDGKVDFNFEIAAFGKVLIKFDSSALGDTLAWLPACLAFKEKHQCDVVLCVDALWRDLVTKFTDLQTISFGQFEVIKQDCSLVINIGCYDEKHSLFSKSTFDWRTVPLAQIAAKQLRVDTKELPKLVYRRNSDPERKYVQMQKYVCISEHATTRGKMWNNSGQWQMLVDILTDYGYNVCTISREATHLENVTDWTGEIPILERAAQLYQAKFFIGLSSGLSWLAHSVGCYVYMINTATHDWNEFQDNCTHIGRRDVCRGCWNEHKWDLARNYEWCPAGLNFQCSNHITAENVLQAIKNKIGDL